MPPTAADLRHRAPGPPAAAPSETLLADQLPSNKADRKLVGIDGNWYDITDFMPRHPGGPIIEMFVGKDATTAFHAAGHKDVLKHRRPVGTYSVPNRHPADDDFDKLAVFFKENGYFVTNYLFYVKKLTVALGLLAMAFWLVIGFEEWYWHYLGAVCLAFHWQQIGFIMHEFMHTQVLRNRSWDHMVGCFFGTTCFGMSAHWWQDEHIFHHLMTNTVDPDTRFADPQMWESVWAQNEKMFPLFSGKLAEWMISIQHITFIPVVMFCGRLEILTDSYYKERRWFEWVCIAMHWTWMIFLLSHFTTWRELIIFYTIASSVEGIFHFQLILSHYCKAFLFVSEFHQSSWYVQQILSNLNIDSPWWQDWYYGGLNYHIEHHLFPLMARDKLRQAAPYVKAICDKHDIDYDSCSMTRALIKTLQHLKVTGRHYKLTDFR